MAQLLEDEATARDESERGALFYHAGVIHSERTGETEESIRCFKQARQSGLKNADLLAELATAAQAGANWPEAVQLLAESGRLVEGNRASELFQDAALLANQYLNQPEIAAGHLESAVEASPSNYAALSMYRDQLSILGRTEERVGVLEKIAEITNGRVASEAYWQLGRLLQRLGKDEQARNAFGKGRSSDPSHAPSLVALEKMLGAAGDHQALGDLYTDEAKRDGQPDSGWWHLRAARAFTQCGDQSKAGRAFSDAVKAGCKNAHREYQAWLLGQQDYTKYAKSIESEIKGLDSQTEKAFAWYRLGQVMERELSDPAGALKSYQKAVACDPKAHPVNDAVARVMLSAGKTKDLIKFWEGVLKETEEKNVQISIRFRMGELAESSLGNFKKSRDYFEGILTDWDPHYLPALESLQRVYRKLKDWDKLAGVFETLSGLAEVPADKAQHLTRAGNVARYESKDTSRAAELYRRALDIDPGYANALEEYLDLLESSEEWSPLATTLRTAAENHVGDAGKVSLYYRAGRIFADRLADPVSATGCFQKCRELSPEFLPATVMLKQIAVTGGDSSQVYGLYKSQASVSTDPSERDWWLMAANAMADGVEGVEAHSDLNEILGTNPAHVGAMVAKELNLLLSGSSDALVELYKKAAATSGDPLLYSRLAELADAQGDIEGLQVSLEAMASSEEVPFRRVGARRAEARQLWPIAAKLLEESAESEDRLEWARLKAIRLAEPEVAMGVYKEYLEDEKWCLPAALGTALIGQQLGDAVALQKAYGLICEKSTNADVKAAHGLWTAQLCAAAQAEPEEMLRFYQLALDNQGNSARAFDGVRHALVSSSDAEGLKALYDTHRPDSWLHKARDLDAVGDRDGAIETLRAVKDHENDGLAALTYLEMLLGKNEDWSGVYSVLEEREQKVKSDAVKSRIGAKKRWLLAEKLAETDEAWELYQKLHEEAPADREVTEALARIAGLRGQTEMGIKYLSELADTADSPVSAGRYQVRIAEVYEAAGNLVDARQSFLNALDHQPADEGALSGLKRIAETEEDWPGLVQVLKRECGLAEGQPKIDGLRRIALITQERLNDPAVAMDAWRKLIEQSPQAQDALEEITTLAEIENEWGTFVEYGEQLVKSEGFENTSDLLTRLGIACLDQLEREDGIQFLEIAAQGDSPSLAATERLEVEYTKRQQWDGVISMLQTKAGLQENSEGKVEALSNAANIALSKKSDRTAAARIHEQIFEADSGQRDSVRFLASYFQEDPDLQRRLKYFQALAEFIEEDLDMDDFDEKMELSTFYFQLGTLMQEVGSPNEAVVALERALELNANHAPSLKIIGPLYVANESWKKAEKIYRSLLQLTGGYGDKLETASTYSQLGRVEFALGNSVKARKRFSKALELHPNHIGALKGLSSLLKLDEDWEQLLNIHNNIIYHGTDPADVIESYMLKGQILDQALDRPKKAAQHYVRSLQIDPNQPGALLRLAELALRRQDWYEAGGYAQRGLQLVPGAGPMRADLLLSWAIAKMGTGDEAGAQAAVVDARACHPPLNEAFGEEPLKDLEGLSASIRSRISSI